MIRDKEVLRRQKISQKLKGRTPWNKGLKNWRVISDETRRKIGLAHKGKMVIVSDETRKKISQTMKGKSPKNLELLHTIPYTDERRKKLSVAHKGKTLSEETRRKISNSKRNPLKPLYKAVRECYKYREWRTSIYRRDNYTCSLCGKRGCELNADHYPKRFVDILRELEIDTIVKALNCPNIWDLNAGRTLCKKCHMKTETYGRNFKEKVIKVTD
jgi:5-methylcytosine-specific restriction endonuclease McrA